MYCKAAQRIFLHKYCFLKQFPCDFRFINFGEWCIKFSFPNQQNFGSHPCFLFLQFNCRIYNYNCRFFQNPNCRNLQYNCRKKKLCLVPVNWNPRIRIWKNRRAARAQMLAFFKGELSVNWKSVLRASTPLTR